MWGRTGKAREKQVLTQEVGDRLSGKSGDLLLFCVLGWKNFREEVQDLTFTQLGLGSSTYKLGPRAAASQGRWRIQCDIGRTV